MAGFLQSAPKMSVKIGRNVLPFEEPEIDAEDDLDEREYESNRPKRSKRMTATACDFVYY